MKTTLLAVATAFLLAGCASTYRMKSPGYVTVQSRAGVAEISRQGGAFKKAARGNFLRPGDVARTGAQGRIDFDLGRFGGVLTLHPYSTLRFEQIGIAGDPEVLAILELPRGRVTGDTLELPDGASIVVKTPAGEHRIP